MDYEAANGQQHSDDNEHRPDTSTAGLTAPGAAAAMAAGAVPLTPGPDGVIVLPAGVELDDILVRGRDLVIQTDSGQTYVIVDGAVFVPTLVVDGVTVPPLNLAALLNGVDIAPAAGTTQSSGGNFADPVGDIQAAYKIGDLLPYTDFGRAPEPGQEIIPGLVNREPATEIVTDNNPAGAVNATADVFEKGLPPHAPSLPAGSGEIADGNANNNSDTSETTTGTIVIDSPDGVQTLTLNGVQIVANGSVIANIPPIVGSFGTITITSVDIPGGAVGFSYTLTASTSGPGTHDDFAVQVIDPQGDIANATLMVNITDDGPIASPDTNTVTEGALLTVAASGVLGNDIPGADGYAAGGGVVGVTTGSNVNQVLSTGVNTNIPGAYGTLKLQADGSYTYQSDPNKVTANAVDHFVYTIRDGDGSTSTTTLDITVTNVTLAGVNITRTVDEAALDTTQTGHDLAVSTVTGTTGTSSDAETVFGTLNNPAAKTNGYTPQSVTTAYGEFQLNADGSYVYTLINPVPSGANPGPNTVAGVDSFTYSFVDANGNSGTGSVTINVIDDVPTAHADTNAVTEGALLDVLVANGVLANDVSGADGYTAGGGVIGVTTGSNVNQVITTGVGGTGISGAYGTLTLQADGSYTYKSDPDKITPATLDKVDHFVYTIRDADGDTSTTTLDITVNDVSLEGVNIERTVDEAALDNVTGGHDLDHGSVIGSAGTASDAETVFGTLNNPAAKTNGYTPQSVTTAYGEFQLNADGSYVYTLINPVPSGANPGPNTVAGVESFTYSFVDANGNSGTGSVTINVIDDVPTARDDGSLADPYVLAENTPLTIPVLANDTFGADGQNSPAIVSFTQPSLGSVILAANNTFTVTPPNNISGTTTFTYTIKDGDGDVSTATVYLEFARDSVPQVINPANVTVDEDGFVGNPVTANQDNNRSGELTGNGLLTNTGTVTIAFGGDKPATPLSNITLSTTGLSNVLHTVNGAVTFTQPGGPGTPLVGSDGVHEVIKISIISAVDGPNPGEVIYTYQVQLEQPIKHPDGNGELSQTLPNIQFSGTDSDGTPFSGSFNAIIFDDVPYAKGTPYNIGLVHEDALATAGATGNPEGGGQVASATISTATLQSLVSVGADVPLSISLNSALTGPTGLTQNGTAINWHYVSATQIDGVVGNNNSAVVFSITKPGADWLFTLKDNIDHDTDGDLTTGNGDAFATSLSLNNVFVASDSDNDKVFIASGVTISIQNDVPRLSGTPYDIGTVHEDALVGGNFEGGQTTTASILTANLQAMISPGADAPVTILLNDALSGATGRTQDGNAINWHYVNAGQIDGIVGNDTSAVVFSITQSGGNWLFTLKDNIDHGTLTDDNGDSYDETLSLANVFIARDSDGDSVPLSAGITIDIENDIPKLTGTTYMVGEVQEDALPDGNPEGGQTTTASILTATLQTMVSAGADSPATIVLNSAISGATGLTQGATAINWHYVSATQIDGVVGNDNSAVVFSITKSGSDWLFTLKDNIDHGTLLDDNGDNYNVVPDLSLANVFVAVDSDGDRLPISSGITIAIENDVPIAYNDRSAANPFVIAENTPLTISVLTDNGNGADSFGADGPAATPIISYTQPSIGSVTLNPDNTFTITPPNSGSGAATFTYTIRDGDGDTATATVYLSFQSDSEPQILKVDTVVVDEDGFTGVPPAPLTPIANVDNGTAGEIDSNEKLVNTGEIVINFGADVPSNPLATTNMHLVDTAGLDTQLKTLDGNAVTFALSGGDLVGSGTGGEVIRIHLDSYSAGPNAGDITYIYKVTLSQPIKHDDGGGELSKMLTGVTFAGQDSDGSPFQGTLSVQIFDDIPQPKGTSYFIGEVHEDALNTVGVAVGNGESVSPAQTTTATIATASLQALVNAGADGPVSISLNSALTGPTGLTQNGTAINWHYVSATQIDGVVGNNNSAVVFSITKPGADWLFTLKDNIDHDDDGSLLTGTNDNFDATLHLDNVFIATDRDGDKVTIATGVTIDIENDVPKLKGTTYEIGKVHEDALNIPGVAVGNPEGGQTTTATILTATLAGLVSAGADAPVAIILNDSLTGATGLKQGGTAINWRYVSDTQVDGIVGNNTSAVVFSITKSGGDWTFTLKDNIDHGTLTDDNGDAYSEKLNLDNVFVARDTDGDKVAISAGVSILIENDIPKQTVATSQVAVGEDTLPGGNPDAGDTKTLTDSGSLAALVNFGADGPGSFAFDVTGQTGPSLTSGGLTVKYANSLDGLTLIGYTGATSADGQVFTVTFTNATTGAYTFLLKAPLDHIPNSPANDDNQNLTLQLANMVVAKDADGDAIRLSGGFSVLVEDDIPFFFSTFVQSQKASNDINQTPAVGTLHLAPGADHVASMVITANLTGITSGGHTLKAVMTSANVLTGYYDANSNNTFDVGTDTEVFTLTVNTGAGTSGQYVFDLKAPLDGGIVDTAIGDSTSFGAGPAPYQYVSQTDVTVDPLALISGWAVTNAFDVTNWYNGTNVLPAGVVLHDINGSSSGWGVDNNNFTNNELIRIDFGAFNDFDGAGPYTAPAPAVPLPQVSTATFDFIGFGSSEKVMFVIHNTDGSTKSFTATGTTVTSGAEYTIATDLGKTIAWIDLLSTANGGAKIDFVKFGVQSTVVDSTIPFTLNVTDGDGDTTTTQAFTVHVKDGLAPDAPVAPIVLDLDGNGAEFVSRGAGHTFDYYSDGHAEATAWAGQHDGILAIDLDGDGQIASASEFVFGTNGLTDLQGLAATYDSNHDGVLDASDARFADFGVWKGDGSFQSLTDAGIASINLTSDGVGYTAADGDVTVHGTTTYTKLDGTTGTAADATFLTGDGSEVMGALLDANAPAPAQDTDVAAVQGALAATVAALTVDTVVDHYTASDGADAAPPPTEPDSGDLIALLNSSIASSIEHSAPPVTMETYDDHAALAAAAA